MLRAALSLALFLFAVDGFAKDFLFRTLPQDLPGFNSLPTRYIRAVNNLAGDDTIFVTTGAGIGISNDGGKTYSMRTMRAGLPSNNVRRTAFTEDGVIYVQTYGSELRLAMSQDAGQSFQDITMSLPDPSFPLGVYSQGFFSVGKRVFMLFSDLRVYYNTDSEGGPFVKIDLAKELGLDANYTLLTGCPTEGGDLVIAITSTQRSGVLTLVRLKIDGIHHSLTTITPADKVTTDYMQRTQNSMTCFTRNGSPELALTRLTSQLAFLSLNDDKMTYTHSVQIPTDSNYGSTPIYPMPIVRAGKLFIVGYPSLIQYLVDANGKDAGFYSQLLNAQDPKSDQNQIMEIQPASNGDWLVATQWGWFRCENSLHTCAEVVPTSKRFYDSGVLDQNSQGFIFPNTFVKTSNNSSNAYPLFWANDHGSWMLDRNFENPIPFSYPQKDQYYVQNAFAANNRMAIMTIGPNSNVQGRVLYVEQGSISSAELPARSRYQVPMISGIDVNGERVLINVEGNTYMADFGGNFTAMNLGGLSNFNSFYGNGKILALSSGNADGHLAISLNGGKNYTIVNGTQFGLPAGKVQLSAFRGYAIAAVLNALYQVSFSPFSSMKFFVDPSTDRLIIQGSSESGIWLDAGPSSSSNSKPRVIASDGNCYKLDGTNGLSGDDDFMAFVVGMPASLYFASADGVVQLQNGFNKTADCGVAKLP